jgi:hypothetical protein
VVVDDFAQAPQLREGHDGHHDQGHEHDHALHEVRQADREEAAEQGVGDHHARSQEQAQPVVEAEAGFKQLAARHNA